MVVQGFNERISEELERLAPVPELVQAVQLQQ
jgi:hypothetical protein